MALWAIIPIKPLWKGKSRLASILTQEERYSINYSLFRNTLKCIENTSGISGCIVVSSDQSVLSIAREYGAQTVQEPRLSTINRALRRATIAARAFNASQVMILPADLPKLNSLAISSMIACIKDPPEIIIAPDHKNEGTNALILNPIDVIEYNYGPWSFSNHVQQAQQKKVRVEIFYDENFRYDLDLPEDWNSLKSQLPIKN